MDQEKVKTTGVARHWLLAAGYAASEVGALMTLSSIIALFRGNLTLAVLIDAVPFAAFAAWLWWRKSVIAAVLTIAFVSFEYWYLWAHSATDNPWPRTYAVIFLVAIFAYTRKPKAAKTPS